MRLAADIYLYWTLAALAIVSVRVVQVSWCAREAKRKAVYEERRTRAYQRLLDDLCVGNPVGPRVESWVYPTPQGGELRWKVRASCDAEAAEILSQSFKPEVA